MAKLKIIFDENVPWPLRKLLPDYEITSIQKEGWAGIENGEIIERIDGEFDVLILADKNLRYQQNLKNRTIALIELPTNRLTILESMAPKIIETLKNIQTADYIIIQELE